MSTSQFLIYILPRGPTQRLCVCALPKNKTEAENVLQLVFTLGLKNYEQGTVAQRLGSCLSKKWKFGVEQKSGSRFSLDLNWFSWVGLTLFPVLCRTYTLLRSTKRTFLSLDPEFRNPQFHVPSCHLEQLIPSDIT